MTEGCKEWALSYSVYLLHGIEPAPYKNVVFLKMSDNN